MELLQMEVKKPKAVECYPAYGNSFSPFPEDLSPKATMEKDKVYLYNPFVNGQRFLPKSPNAITLFDLQKHFIVDKAGNRDIGVTDASVQKLFRDLKTSWDSMLDYVANQLATEITMEPKQRGRKKQLTPEDIKMIISKPNQKIDGPKLKMKGLAPPKPR